MPSRSSSKKLFEILEITTWTDSSKHFFCVFWTFARWKQLWTETSQSSITVTMEVTIVVDNEFKIHERGKQKIRRTKICGIKCTCSIAKCKFEPILIVIKQVTRYRFFLAFYELVKILAKLKSKPNIVSDYVRHFCMSFHMEYMIFFGNILLLFGTWVNSFVSEFVKSEETNKT